MPTRNEMPGRFRCKPLGLACLMLGAVAMNASGPARAMPMTATDEGRVPHYFGP